MKFLLLILIFVACATHCLALKNDVCGLPHSIDGNGVVTCFAYIPSWSYDSNDNECVNFIYGGCGGNKNRFKTKEECEETCVV
ncbi:hypothetical protein KR215_000243 [Drosophila sulfurigaster]|nr:hypothetical protein KR215_000243 [Drosophila sulfurigaster]